MQRTNWKDFAELIGIGAIIASLVFVGLQLQQTHRIAIGDSYQARTGLILAAQAIFFGSDRLADARSKMKAGEELTADERDYMARFQDVWLSYYENNHFQFELGLLSEEHWESSKEALKSGVVGNELLIDLYHEKRGTLRASFMEEVDRLVQENMAEE